MIKILGRKILMEEIKEEQEEKTESGLYIPQAAQKQKLLTKGKVISFGVECTEVSEGDIVYVDVHSAANIELKGVEYMLADESSIFAIER